MHVLSSGVDPLNKQFGFEFSGITVSPEISAFFQVQGSYGFQGITKSFTVALTGPGFSTFDNPLSSASFSVYENDFPYTPLLTNNPGRYFGVKFGNSPIYVLQFPTPPLNDFLYKFVVPRDEVYQRF